MIAFHGPHNHPGIDSLIREEIHHTRTDASSRSIDRECHLNSTIKYFRISTGTTLNELNLPHILSGASNSSSIGCDKNISRDFRHSPRISASVNWTFLPGLDPRTEKKSKLIKITLGYGKHVFDRQYLHKILFHNSTEHEMNLQWRVCSLNDKNYPRGKWL